MPAAVAAAPPSAQWRARRIEGTGAGVRAGQNLKKAKPVAVNAAGFSHPCREHADANRQPRVFHASLTESAPLFPRGECARKCAWNRAFSDATQTIPSRASAGAAEDTAKVAPRSTAWLLRRPRTARDGEGAQKGARDVATPRANARSTACGRIGRATPPVREDLLALRRRLLLHARHRYLHQDRRLRARRSERERWRLDLRPDDGRLRQQLACWA